MKTISQQFITLFLVIVSCSSPLEKNLVSEKKKTAILFKQVDIFNGKDSVLLRNKDVLVQNGIILQISDSISGDSNALIIEAAGKTLMPGLIDSHVHLSGSGSVPWDNHSANEEYNLSAYLYTGITTVYDLGGIAKSIEKLADKVKEDEISGPTIYHTHIPISVKNSHPIPLTEIMLPWPLKSLVNAISPTIDQVEEAPKLIEKYVSNTVDYVKISCDQIPPGSPEMSYDQMKALISEAHKLDKKVFVHIGSPENAVNAIKAGADVLAHGIWRGKLTPDQADVIADSKVPIIYTLAGFHNIHLINQGEFEPNKLDEYLVDTKILAPVTGENGREVHQQKVMKEFFENVSQNHHFWQDNFKLLHIRKAVFAIGTDSNLPGTYAGSTYFQEMELLHTYGLSNFEILKGATFINSTLFLENPNFGMIDVGKEANLLLINGNPLSDLDLLKSPLMIVKKGNIIERL